MYYIKFLKPFEKAKEGYEITAIVSYRKTPWVAETVEGKKKVVSYRYGVRINLWFVLLEFDWVK